MKLHLFAVATILATFTFQAPGVAQSNSSFLGKWCGSGTLEITSVSPIAGTYAPTDQVLPVFGIGPFEKGPIGVQEFANGTLRFIPAGTGRAMTLALSGGKLAGTVERQGRKGTSTYPVTFSKCP